MLAWLLNIPLELRLAALFLAGVVLGSLVNLGIYRLAWDARNISPWSPAPEEVPPRRWYDRLPVIGWLFLRRERSHWGRGFWIRPLLIELATGAGLALLYVWEIRGDLVPLQAAGFNPAALAAQAMLHQQFVSHALLILLMVVATFIDFDEKTIPDWITVPGTLAGLLLAALWPSSLPTSLVLGPPPAMNAVKLEPLWLTSPLAWPASLSDAPGLALALFCYWGWCFAILDKRWILRHGWKKAFGYLYRSIVRVPWWYLAPALAVLGTPLIVAAWLAGGALWAGLLTSLCGLAFGGGLVWAVRIIGHSALRQEAMGFGDVTLMAMIGTFVGWQGALLTFFFAPFAALVIAVAQFLFTRRHDIAFGPYLCLSALYVLLQWPEIWERAPIGRGARDYFEMGVLIPAITAICLVLMWGMLKLTRMLRQSLESDEYAEE